MPLSQIDGIRNPADLMTKHLASTKAAVHLHTMNLAFKGGRAEAAANLYALKATDERKTTSQRKIVTMPCYCYKWKEVGDNVVIDEDEDKGHEGWRRRRRRGKWRDREGRRPKGDEWRDREGGGPTADERIL